HQKSPPCERRGFLMAVRLLLSCIGCIRYRVYFESCCVVLHVKLWAYLFTSSDFYAFIYRFGVTCIGVIGGVACGVVRTAGEEENTNKNYKCLFHSRTYWFELSKTSLKRLRFKV